MRTSTPLHLPLASWGLPWTTRHCGGRDRRKETVGGNEEGKERRLKVLMCGKGRQRKGKKEAKGKGENIRRLGQRENIRRLYQNECDCKRKCFPWTFQSAESMPTYRPCCYTFKHLHLIIVYCNVFITVTVLYVGMHHYYFFSNQLQEQVFTCGYLQIPRTNIQ